MTLIHSSSNPDGWVPAYRDYDQPSVADLAWDAEQDRTSRRVAYRIDAAERADMARMIDDAFAQFTGRPVRSDFLF